MHRGEIRLVDFEPSSGQEANKRRPAILVSNDAANSMAQPFTNSRKVHRTSSPDVRESNLTGTEPE